MVTCALSTHLSLLVLAVLVAWSRTPCALSDLLSSNDFAVLGSVILFEVKTAPRLEKLKIRIVWRCSLIIASTEFRERRLMASDHFPVKMLAEAGTNGAQVAEQ